jgi:hypothetical protein
MYFPVLTPGIDFIKWLWFNNVIYLEEQMTIIEKEKGILKSVDTTKKLLNIEIEDNGTHALKPGERVVKPQKTFQYNFKNWNDEYFHDYLNITKEYILSDGIVIKIM